MKITIHNTDKGKYF